MFDWGICGCVVHVQEVLDDDSDDDFEAISLDEEDDDDVIAISDDDSGEEPEPKPKPAKRAKPSPAAAAASKAKAGSTPAKKGRGKKADRPAMVIEKGTQDTAEKKRKLPGSMVSLWPWIRVVASWCGVFQGVDCTLTYVL
jgi:hypothetical protein